MSSVPASPNQARHTDIHRDYWSTSTAAIVQKLQKSIAQIRPETKITIMLLFIYSLVGILLAPWVLVEAITLPWPTRNTHNVTISHMTLEGSSGPISQMSLFNDTTGSHRRLGISLFFPINSTDCNSTCSTMYMSSSVAHACNAQFFGDEEKGVFDNLQFRTCCGSKSGFVDPSNYTLVVLEPQVGVSRHLYSAMAYEMAGEGNPVVTIDHPGDSPMDFNEWARSTNTSAAQNHTIAKRTLDLNPYSDITSWNTTISNAVQTRVDDVNFVLRLLSDKRVVEDLLPDYEVKTGFKTDIYGIIGNGLGGTVANHLGFHDARFVININMAGTPPKLDNATSPDLYTIFLGREAHRREDDIHWPSTWKHLRGRAVEFDLQASGILDFSDLPLIVNVTSSGEAGSKIKKEDVPGLGSIPGHRSFWAAAQFARIYMTLRFRPEPWDDGKKNSAQLPKLVQGFPEMKPYMPGGGGGYHRRRPRRSRISGV